jgi:hypothetical protein
MGDLPSAVPTRSGEALVVPPVEELLELLRPLEEGAWGDIPVLGTPLRDLRRRLRARALALARAYTSGDPATAPEGDAAACGGGGPLVVMGHQPVLFHPGVWVKFFLLTRLGARPGVVGLHLIGDTDAPGPVGATVPVLRDRLERTAEVLVDLPEGVPLEAAPPPSPSAWDAFCGRLASHVATLPAPSLAGRLEAFAQDARSVHQGARTLGEFLARSRRRYEARAGVPTYWELPLSSLADTAEFRAFALHLLQDPGGLRRTYNRCLEEYRRAHRIRSPANPFPDLEARDGHIEAPFWVVQGGRRFDLFAARQTDRVVLGTDQGPVAAVPAGPEGVPALEASGLVLRPKAVALTMFVRVCLADVFIHGVSGARYDRVTDRVAQELLGCRPAPYAVATATLHLPLADVHVAEERHALSRRLMDLRHNPDRHLAELTEAHRRLVEEKWALIRALEGMRPGPERRAATRRIREINALLASALAPEIARVEARLRALGEQEALEEVVRYREYPFFLFDPGEVAALVGGASREPAESRAGGDGEGPRGRCP